MLLCIDLPLHPAIHTVGWVIPDAVLFGTITPVCLSRQSYRSLCNTTTSPNSGAPLSKGREPLRQLPVLPVASHLVVHACHLQFHVCCRCGSPLKLVDSLMQQTGMACAVALLGLSQSRLISPTCGVCCPLGVSATRKGKRASSEVAQLPCEAAGVLPYSGDCVQADAAGAGGVNATGCSECDADPCSRGGGVRATRAPGCTRAVLTLLVAEPGGCRGVGDWCAAIADLMPGVCLELSGLGCCEPAAAAGAFSLSSAAARDVDRKVCFRLHHCTRTLAQQPSSNDAIEVRRDILQHNCVIHNIP